MDDTQNKDGGANTPDQFEEQLAELIKKTGGTVPPKRKTQQPQESDFSSPESAAKPQEKAERTKTPEEIDAEIEALINSMGAENSDGIQDAIVLEPNAEGARSFSENDGGAENDSVIAMGAENSDAENENKESDGEINQSAFFDARQQPNYDAFFGAQSETEAFTTEEPSENAEPVLTANQSENAEPVFSEPTENMQGDEKSLEEIEAEIAALEREMNAENDLSGADFSEPTIPDEQSFTAGVSSGEQSVESKQFVVFDASADGQTAQEPTNADGEGAPLQNAETLVPPLFDASAEDDLLSAQLEEMLSKLQVEETVSNEQTTAQDAFNTNEAAAENQDYNQIEQPAELNGEHIEIVPTPETFTAPSEPVDVGEFAKVIDKLADALGSDSAQSAQPPLEETAAPMKDIDVTVQPDYAAMEAQLQALLNEQEPVKPAAPVKESNQELNGEIDSLRAQIASLERMLMQKEQSAPVSNASAAETPPQTAPTSSAATAAAPASPAATAAAGDVNAMFKQWFDLEMAAKMKNIISEDEKNKVKTAAVAENKDGAAETEAAPFDSDFVKLGEDVYYNVKEKKAYVLKPVAPVSNLPAVMPQPRPVKKTVKKPVRRPAAKAAPAHRRRRPAGLARPRRPRRPFPRRPGMR